MTREELNTAVQNVCGIILTTAELNRLAKALKIELLAPPTRVYTMQVSIELGDSQLPSQASVKKCVRALLQKAYEAGYDNAKVSVTYF